MSEGLGAPARTEESNKRSVTQFGARREYGLARIRGVATRRPFIVFMALVAVLGAIYYGLIATPLYVSETRFAIRSNEVAAPSGLLAGLVGAPSGLSDISAISDYVQSTDMLDILEERHDLHALYSQPRIDPFKTLSRNASEESFRDFYNRLVTVKLDRESSTVIVEVKSFNPQSAQAVATSILELSETFTNDLTRRMRDETLQSARAELESADQKAGAARSAVAAFRGSRSSLDPTASGAQLVGSVSALEAAATQVRAEIAGLLTYSRPDAPAVRQAQARLNTIENQMAQATAQQGVGTGLSQEVTTFETLQLQRANAEKTLAAAQTGFDQARATAEQREKFVARIVSPNLPQQATSPNRVLEFLTLLIFAMAGYALVSLTLAAIRDHRGI